MPLILRFLLLTCMVVGSLCRAEGAESAVQLPFGLSWGTPSAEVEAALQAAGATIADRKGSAEGRESWAAEGLKQDGLVRLVFTFERGQLANMELQYQKDGWTFATYDEFMHRVRRTLDDRYGVARPRARKKGQSEQIWQTVVRYAWPVGEQEVELVYFAAQDEKNAFNLVSLHYAAKAKPAPAAPRNVRRALPAYAPGDAAPASESLASADEPQAVLSAPAPASGEDELALFPEMPNEPAAATPPKRAAAPAKRKTAMAYAEPELPQR